MNNLFSLEGKLAVVSGGGSGIGLAISTALARAGAKIVIISRNNKKLERAKQYIQEVSSKIDSIKADLSIQEVIDKTSQEIISSHGIPDIIVNTAGVNLRQKAEDISFNDWDTTMNINLKTPFFFSRAFIKDMKKRKSGKIINIASLQSVRAFDNSIPYGASKGGILQLTRAMAQAYSPFGINVNAIAPGFFNTELTATLFQDDKKISELASKTAIGRNGELSDFDGISVFLSSAASDYITGQTIFLDGGFTSK